MNKYFLPLAFALVLCNTPVFAEQSEQPKKSEFKEFHIITAEEMLDLDHVGNAYVASPTNVAKAQRSFNNRLQNMYDTYSLPELAQQALHINQARIRAAKRNGEEPPAVLSREILSDRDKIIEYLKEEYKVRY